MQLSSHSLLFSHFFRCASLSFTLWSEGKEHANKSVHFTGSLKYSQYHVSKSIVSALRDIREYIKTSCNHIGLLIQKHEQYNTV